MNPPSSQITSHLNKAPIKIQLLSLLIGFGSDRQPECQCLFRFHEGAQLWMNGLVGLWNSELTHSGMCSEPRDKQAPNTSVSSSAVKRGWLTRPSGGSEGAPAALDARTHAQAGLILRPQLCRRPGAGVLRSRGLGRAAPCGAGGPARWASAQCRCPAAEGLCLVACLLL